MLNEEQKLKYRRALINVIYSKRESPRSQHRAAVIYEKMIRDESSEEEIDRFLLKRE